MLQLDELALHAMGLKIPIPKKTKVIIIQKGVKKKMMQRPAPSW